VYRPFTCSPGIRGLCVAIACGAVVLTAPAPASAQAMSVLTTCAYSGSRFALDGRGLTPNSDMAAEVMGSADPLAGAPLSARDVRTNGSGRFRVTLDVPATDERRPAALSVRLRPSPDPSIGLPTILASAPLKVVSRSVAVAPGTGTGRAGDVERWRVTGLPEGTRLWAHYRHGGKTVKTIALGAAKDPCGRLSVALRTLPAGHDRAGGWVVWMTSKRTYRVPRAGVYVQRRMTVGGTGSRARVTFATVRSRLVSGDPRIGAPVTNFFAAYATQIGVIRMVFDSGEGAPVDFFERIGEHLRPLGRVQAGLGEQTILEDATTWSCSRVTRRFVASATLPDGSMLSGASTIHTPSCASRLRLSAPRRVAAGREIAIRVIDRWGNGAITPTLCITPPAQRERCRRLAFPAAVTILTRRVRARTRGIWRIDLRLRGRHLRGAVGVGEKAAGAGRLPTLLATGDSMMEGIDGFLADELAGTAEVAGDARPGTGISKMDPVQPRRSWTQIAAEQVATLRPVATVVLIGAADGFDMLTPAGIGVQCCDEPWIAEYGRRVRAMIESYLRGGRGRVFWLTLPLPRPAGLVPVVTAVNTAIRRAADGVAGATVVGLDVLFTPAGYSDVLRYRGRTVRVREVDGLHLNTQGQAIVARTVAELVRRDG